MYSPNIWQEGMHIQHIVWILTLCFCTGSDEQRVIMEIEGWKCSDEVGVIAGM